MRRHPFHPLRIVTPSRNTINDSATASPLLRNPLHALWFILLQCCTGGIYVFVNSELPWTNVDLRHRTKTEWYNDALVLALLSLSTFAIGGHHRFFFHAPPMFHRRPVIYNLALYVVSPVSCVLYGALNNVKWLRNSLTSPSAWEPPSVFVYVGTLSMIIILLCRALFIACRCRIRFRFRFPRVSSTITQRSAYENRCTGWSEVSVIILLLVVMFVIPWSIGAFYLHHYQIAFVVTWLCTRNTVFDRVCMWISMGVMVHGIVAYGAAPVGAG